MTSSKTGDLTFENNQTQVLNEGDEKIELNKGYE